MKRIMQWQGGPQGVAARLLAVAALVSATASLDEAAEPRPLKVRAEAALASGLGADGRCGLAPVDEFQEAVADDAARRAACRVQNQLPGGAANVGSGTLVDVKRDGGRGLVLTCAHLFTEGAGRIVVEFPNGRAHGALLVAVDAQADLAALEIANPSAPPAPLAENLAPAGRLRACGFGPRGEFRCIAGEVLGYTQGAGQVSVRLAGAVRSGDSGGGVFDARGRLAAVVWGAADGETYASTGRPLASFLARVLGRREGLAAPAPGLADGATCPDGRCPLVGGAQAPRVIAGSLPAGGSPAGGGATGGSAREDTSACGCAERLGAMAAALERISASKQDRGDYLLRNEAPPAAPAGGLSAALGRAAVAAGAAAGVAGPAGLGVAAATIGGWLAVRGVRRVRARRRPGSEARACERTPGAARAASTQEGTAAADIAFLEADEQAPVERDDREARELLRLSQFEGRDPLQDALAGRLALDRLDAAAESDADPHQARWADGLRRELRERFNDIAPTKFQVNAEG
jgi:hypothetical protein